MAVVMLAALGSCGDALPITEDLATSPDLSPQPQDLSDPLSGVPCGPKVCAPALTCCSDTSSCVGTAGPCMESALRCDGPEDCATGYQCCATVSAAVNTTACGVDCPAAVDSMLSTRTCRSRADCNGYVANSGGAPVPLSSCCETPTMKVKHCTLASAGINCSQ
jgi:hypothetical protein